MKLSSNYKFKKFEIGDKNKFTVYGDNLEESTQIIKWLYDFNTDRMKFIGIEYASLSEYIYKYEINGEIYYFVAKAYYRNGKLPYDVRHVIKELDKPDAVIYSDEREKVLMGFETTSTTMAGNATWQRSGRIINFLEGGIPFGFLAYFSKNDKSDKNANKKPRVPGALFVLMFNMLSLKYNTPALVGFFEHPDKAQNIDALNPNDDWREPIFKYLLSLVLEEDGEKYLKQCYTNMKNYYLSNDKLLSTNSEFGNQSLKYLRDDDFEENIISDMKNKINTPFYNSDNIIFPWMPKKINERIHELFPDVKFYQISKNCKAGITFETEKLIEKLNEGKKEYVEDNFKSIKEPTIVIPIKLTKADKKAGTIVPTDDPYNGEIPAFANIYLQSFPKANVMLLLCDHSNANEYNVEALKGRKVYKSIDKYADIVVDLDLNLFSHESENSRVENKSKYEDQFTTEDDVTSFFGTILLNEDIIPSFINPPCGSWSDIHLYPTDKYYYYNRNDDRGDIAYFDDQDETYYFGESKKNYRTLISTLSDEYRKTKNLSEIVLKELNYKYPAKLFAIFKGSNEEAKKILENSNFDFVITVDDTDEVTLEIVGR